MNVGCSYPDPPDRKKIARTRARPRRRQADEDRPTAVRNGGNLSVGLTSTDGQALASKIGSFQGLNQSLQQLPPLDANVDVDLLQQHEFSDPTLNQALSPYDILPRGVRELLEEIYFTYIFNSSLILHHGRFKQSQDAGQLPRFVALSVYALASNFLDPPCKLAMCHTQSIQGLGDVVILGKRCAEAAGTELLQTVDRPTLAHVQACQILALYWGSHGETPRNSMFAGKIS